MRRRYLVEGEDAGALVVSAPEAEVEWWCPSCRSVYPHEPGGD